MNCQIEIHFNLKLHKDKHLNHFNVNIKGVTFDTFDLVTNRLKNMIIICFDNDMMYSFIEKFELFSSLNSIILNNFFYLNFAWMINSSHIIGHIGRAVDKNIGKYMS